MKVSLGKGCIPGMKGAKMPPGYPGSCFGRLHNTASCQVSGPPAQPMPPRPCHVCLAQVVCKITDQQI